MPHVLQDRYHLSLVGSLELQKLVNFHRIDRRSWLPWMPLHDELTKISELEQIEVLEVGPPALQSTGDDTVCEQPLLDLALCFLPPLVVTWVSHDRVTANPGITQRGGNSFLGKHEDVKALSLIGAP